MTTILYSIGYQRTDIEGFVSTLKAAFVDVLVDCRSKPWSRDPDFRTKALESSLMAGGIAYYWRPNLGGKSGHREVGYEGGIVELLALANTKLGVAFMCMEHDPDQCHRGKWITVDLKKMAGVEVVHLFPPPARPKQRPITDMAVGQTTLM